MIRPIEGRSESGQGDADTWFDEVHVVDQEWVEVSLRTPVGRHVRYRIPRRTLFQKVDQAAR
jgi:hypothetical protein